MTAVFYPPTRPQARCTQCGRTVGCSPVDLRVYGAVGAPRCCGQPMTLPTPQPPAGRAGVGRPPRPGVRAEVRRAREGTGEYLGSGLTNLAADGAEVRLCTPVVAGEELVVVVVRPDGRPLVPVKAVARWCRPLGGEQFAAGLSFGRRLGLMELADLI